MRILYSWRYYVRAEFRVEGIWEHGSGANIWT